ncbi:MAG: hypothetical protein AAGA44_16145, partial [Pseudomonadota bacterium]
IGRVDAQVQPLALRRRGMTYPIVFIDFAGPDSEALKTFYSTVFAWDLDAEGNFTAPVAKTLKGAIRNDPPKNVSTSGSRMSRRSSR